MSSDKPLIRTTLIGLLGGVDFCICSPVNGVATGCGVLGDPNPFMAEGVTLPPLPTDGLVGLVGGREVT